MNFEALRHYLESLGETYGVRAFGIKVTQRHKELFSMISGTRDPETGEPAGPDDLYDIYSCTKPVTAACVMQLAERGLLRADEKLGDILPAFRDVRVADFAFDPVKRVYPPYDIGTLPCRNPITIKHLLTMTAGMTYDIAHPALREVIEASGGHASTSDVVNAMAKMPLVFEPGENWHYSLAFDVLASVIEARSGLSFGEYVKKNIFEPLGMRDSYLLADEKLTSRLSALYIFDPKTRAVRPIPKGNPFRFTDRYESGGAGILCTIDDYSRFADAMACGGVSAEGRRILRPESVEAIKTDRLTPTQWNTFRQIEPDCYSYGYGVRTLIREGAAQSPLGEFGWCGASNPYCLMDTKNGLSIFYSQQILYYMRFQEEAHPKIRDLVYEGLRS